MGGRFRVGAEDTHYDVLGIPEDASTADIESAVAQLAHVASALALTAPAQADALWVRIRQISKDLLSGDERRQRYDGSLRGREAPPRVPAPGVAPAAPVVMESAIRPRSAVAVRDTGLRRAGRARRGIADLGVALALMAAVAVLFLQPWNWTHLQSVSPGLALSLKGPAQGKAYASGQSVRLRWSPVGRGTIYRLEIGRGSALADRALAFLPPWRTILTERTDYTLRVVGAQFYFWRVQAQVGGVWHPWSAVSVFAVAAPHAAVPAIRATPGSVVHSRRARLCWGAVPGAVGYRLRIDGHKTVATRSTCTSVTLAPGTHRWQVEAVVKGIQDYLGAYSAPATIRVILPRHSSGVVHRKPAARTHPSRSSRSSSGRGSGTVVVAPPNAVAAVTTPTARTVARSSGGRKGTSHRVKPVRRRTLPASTHSAPPPPPAVPVVHRTPAGRRTHKRSKPLVPPSPASAPAAVVTPTPRSWYVAEPPTATPTRVTQIYGGPQPTPTPTLTPTPVAPPVRPPRR
jgi:hypothetical protein